MAERNYGQSPDKDRIDRTQQDSVFDDDVEEDIDSVQDPYPVNDSDEQKNEGGAEVENPNTDERVREYEDKDHEHEYRSPKAVIDDYKGSTARTNNPFEQQNPLQSTFPASDRDER